MLTELVPVAHIFTWNAGMVAKLVGDFTAEDWRFKDAVGHDPRWILGHITASRHRMVGLMGLPPITAGWEGAFGRGTKPDQIPADFDAPAVLRSFQKAQELMASRWEALTEVDLAKPFGRTLPDGSETVGGALRFLAWHEPYHVGQLGIIRRLVGKPGLG